MRKFKGGGWAWETSGEQLKTGLNGPLNLGWIGDRGRDSSSLLGLWSPSEGVKASERKLYPKYFICFSTYYVCTHLRGADSAGAMIWMRNACHRLLCLNTWSPVGVLKGCRTFKRQKLAGRSGLLEASLNFLGTVPPPVCSLLPDYKHNVINSFLLLRPYLLCPVGIYSLKLEARINPSLNCFLPGMLSQQEK